MTSGDSNKSAKAVPLNRLMPLDWLRGLMALSIVFYHFGHQTDAQTPLGRLGIYGVCIFFVLSGLSMGIAYDRYIKDVRSSAGFFVRRIFRIWPLLWVAIALVVIAGTSAGHQTFGASTILLNLTTLFGFVAPDDYINQGAWSIGNEMVYYALTPLLIAAYHRHKLFGNMLLALATGIGLVFAFRLLSPLKALAAQWPTYINPLNNLWLYCAGLALYFNFRDFELPKAWRFPLLAAMVIAFFLYPVSGDQIALVTGVGRVVMTLIAIAIVFGFYRCAPVLPRAIGNAIEQLGIATYGVYLLHPIVMNLTMKAFDVAGIHIKRVPVAVAIVATIVLALVSYRYFESPLTNLGKRLTKGRTVSTELEMIAP
jgi:exopolysaccharide production protein ExoZ